MTPTVSDISALVDELAPPEFGLPGDPGGLQFGDPQAEAGRVLVALDLTDAVLDEARTAGASMLVVHHPPIFEPLRDLRLDGPHHRLLLRAAASDIAVFACHTPLDAAPGGINDYLAGRLGLAAVRPLLDTGRQNLYKIVVFVPAGHEERVRDAMGEAGAGHIGQYSHCTFMTKGTGTFKALPGANPFTGEIGELEQAAEYRLETIAAAARLPQVLAAMLAAHPYEEVAYDVYPLHNQGKATGLGRIGVPEAPLTGEEWLKRCLSIWPSAAVAAGRSRLTETLSLAAVCSGDGGRLVEVSLRAGAGALVTGETGYHDRLLAEEEGLLLVEVGHGPSEVVYLPVLAARLGVLAAAKGWNLEVRGCGY